MTRGASPSSAQRSATAMEAGGRKISNRRKPTVVNRTPARGKASVAEMRYETDLNRLVLLSYLRLILGSAAVICGLLAIWLQAYLWRWGHALISGLSHILLAILCLKASRLASGPLLIVHSIFSAIGCVLGHLTSTVLATYELWCDVGHHCDCVEVPEEKTLTDSLEEVSITPEALWDCHEQWAVVPVDMLAAFFSTAMLLASLLASVVSWALGRHLKQQKTPPSTVAKAESEDNFGTSDRVSSWLSESPNPSSRRLLQTPVAPGDYDYNIACSYHIPPCPAYSA